MRIGEVAERTNTPTTTIRYYERIGLIPEPERISGRRSYTEDVLEHLEAIATAKGLGFTLEEIRLLLGTFRSEEEVSRDCREMAEEKLRELDALIADARRMQGILEHGLICNCASLQGCYIAGQR